VPRGISYQRSNSTQQYMATSQTGIISAEPTAGPRMIRTLTRPFSTHARTVSRMKAIQISKPGDVSVLEYKDVPIPTLQAGQVLVRNAYSGVNFIDTYPPVQTEGNLRRYFRSGLYLAPEVPYTLGREGAGVVAQVGEGVSEFKNGDRVAYMSSAVDFR
jgi:NADPH-dependent curcumin reductase CurA